MAMNRRQFLKTAGGCVVGGTILAAGGRPFATEQAAAATQTLIFTVTDAMKDMVTHNSINKAQCYFWIYNWDNPPAQWQDPLWPGSPADYAAEVPGPNIFATEGDTIDVQVTNALDEDHAFFVPGIPGADTGPVVPGATANISFVLPPGSAGTHLYYDNLNEPVNRVMGLHGALVVMPAAAVPGHKWTPYSSPTDAVQRLFDDLGTADHFPGLAWEEGSGNPGDPGYAPPFRQYIWLINAASSCLFAEVGDWGLTHPYDPGDPGGADYPAADFLEKYVHDPFVPNGINRKPEFFTINGQSGHFTHNNPFIAPSHRVGEPALIRCLNAGLGMHSLHLHANHFYLLNYEEEGVEESLLWLDVYSLHSLQTMDWLIPFMRPPDVPNVGGIGLPDTPMQTVANPLIPGSAPHPAWPPTEELNTFLPAQGETTTAGVPLHVRLSPLCYPMHDHSENSQTAQGGNYNNGMVSGMFFTGDRNLPGGLATFPDEPEVHGPGETGPAAGPDVSIGEG